MSFLKKHKALSVAMAVFVMAQALDIIVTALVAAFIQGGNEGNPLVRDSLHFPIFSVIYGIKFLYILMVAAFSMSLYAGTESDLISSLPVYYFAYQTLEIGFFSNAAALIRVFITG